MAQLRACVCRLLVDSVRKNDSVGCTPNFKLGPNVESTVLE